MLPIFRCTLPSRYPAGTAGHADPTAREGHYVRADSVAAAVNGLRARLCLPADEDIEVQTQPVAADAPVTVTMTASQACVALAALESRAPAAEACRAIESALGRVATTPRLPPLVRRDMPAHLTEPMRLWRLGELARVPSEYVEWHRRLAVHRAHDLYDAGCVIENMTPVSDGWFDGMTAVRVLVRTPSGRVVTLDWHDDSQDFMVNTGHGRAALGADDLR